MTISEISKTVFTFSTIASHQGKRGSQDGTVRLGFGHLGRLLAFGRLLDDLNHFFEVRKRHGDQLGVDLLAVDHDLERGSAADVAFDKRIRNCSLKRSSKCVKLGNCKLYSNT